MKKNYIRKFFFLISFLATTLVYGQSGIYESYIIIDSGSGNTYYDLTAHRLYFSSDGAAGYGGLDVFSSNGEKSKWEEAENMGKDINSSADDLDFTLTLDGKGGFLVSNRKGETSLLSPTCCDDIYEFAFTEFIDLTLRGKVLDSSECLKNYTLKLYIKDKETNEKYLSKEYKIDIKCMKYNKN